jgi:carbamoyltransferase
MITLGIHDGHTATACIIKDGRIIAVVSEERLNRVKEWGGFPELAISECMRIANIKSEEIDGVGIAGIMKPTVPQNYYRPHFYKRVFGSLSRIGLHGIIGSNQMIKSTQRVLSLLRDKREIEIELSNIGIKKTPVFYEHHFLHAATAHLTAWFNNDRNLILTSDGSGDAVSATVNIAEKTNIHRAVEISHYHSISELYTQITQYLGMKPMSHEYKVMGMAPYAKKEYAQKTLHLLQGYFKLNHDLMTFENMSAHWKWQYLEKLHNDLKGHRFDNIAWAIQTLFEEIMTSWVNACLDGTGIGNLVLSGGSFMNVKVNNLILSLNKVKNLFIFPSCGDESLAIGAALVRYLDLGGNEPIPPLGSVYFGPEYTEQDIHKTLDNYSDLVVTRVSDIDTYVGQKLAQGKVIARFSGRMEFGARALGNRSILADPRDRSVVKKINEAIKNRDFWMPFAPSIIEERGDDYIVNPKHFYAPYMIIAFPTKSKAHTDFISALHPYDLTCRPQIVRNDWNHGYYRLLRVFESQTGVGGILNTSFNLHGDPIVCSPDDALRTFVN